MLSVSHGRVNRTLFILQTVIMVNVIKIVCIAVSHVARLERDEATLGFDRRYQQTDRNT